MHFHSRSTPTSNPHSSGFTLLELAIVILVLGVVAGIGVAGIDRFDPGNLGLRTSLETFFESSRDRARVSGQPVTVVQLPATEQKDARLLRFVYRRSLEASFEEAFSQRENLHLTGSASLGTKGRFGACADLREGGTVAIEGRGTPNLKHGFSLDMDIYSPIGESGELFSWDGFLTIAVRRSGVVAVTLRAGNGELEQNFLLESPSGSAAIRQWQHLKLVAADETFFMQLDGREVARMAIPAILAEPIKVPVFGNDDKGWRGLVDEFTVWARVGEFGPEIPDTVTVEPAKLRLQFDRNGMLDADLHPRPVKIVLRDLGDEIGFFVVGRFTQEASL